MPENTAITKDDLKNALNEVVGHLVGVIKETVAASEARIMAEMDRRFAESQREFTEFRAEFVAHRNEFVAHRNEFVAHRNEFVAHRNEFVALQNKFDAHSAEFVAHRNEFVALQNKFDAHHAEFVTFRDDVYKRFRRAEKQRLVLSKRVDNHFYELDSKIINRFDRAMEYTDKTEEKLNRAWTTKLDGQAGVIDDFRTEQIVMGKVQDEIRDDLEKTKNSHGVEIKDLKHRVTALEEEVFPASADKD